jgi:hypothetical protein
MKLVTERTVSPMHSFKNAETGGIKLVVKQ